MAQRRGTSRLPTILAVCLATGWLISATSTRAVVPISKPDKGFKLLLPNGWDVVTLRNIGEVTKRDATNLKGLNGPTLAQFDLFAVPDGAGAPFAENLVIQSIEGSDYFTTKDMNEVERVVIRTLSSNGMTYVPEVKNLVEVDGVNWIKLRGAIDLPSLNAQAVGLVYIAPAKHRTYILMFSAPTATFDQFEPIFEAIAKTFRPDTPLAPPSPYRGQWYLFVALGLGVGAGAGYVTHLLRRS